MTPTKAKTHHIYLDLYTIHLKGEKKIKEYVRCLRKRLYYLQCPLTLCQHGFSTDTYYICHQWIWFPRYHVCKSLKGARVVYPRPSHWPTFCDTFLMFYLMRQFLITPWVITENLQRLWNEHQYCSTWPLVPSTMAISHNKGIKFTLAKTAGWVMLLQWVILKCMKG